MDVDDAPARVFEHRVGTPAPAQRRGVSPWWVAAATVAGCVIGVAATAGGSPATGVPVECREAADLGGELLQDLSASAAEMLDAAVDGMTGNPTVASRRIDEQTRFVTDELTPRAREFGELRAACG